MSDEEDDDKAFDPSQRRLDEARKRGEIPRAPDVTIAAAFAGLLLAVLLSGDAILLGAGQIGQAIIDRADEVSTQVSHGARAALGHILSDYAQVFVPLFVLPFAGVLLVLFAQRGIIFVPEKLTPKLSRISPLATAKQKFGRDGLFAFGKSVVKMLAVGVILFIHLRVRLADLVSSLYLSAETGSVLMMRLMVEFLALILLLSIVSGAVDYFWQQAQHLRRNRMSFKEMRDEAKDSEGDPHVKGQRRQRAQEIALNRMLQDVAKADVVIVNPTHYAVALKWKRSDQHAPVCVAKGVDDLAARIREKAAHAGVPLHPDPPTARALYAVVEVGETIRPEHYKPVAAAIRFAEALRRRKKGLP